MKSSKIVNRQNISVKYFDDLPFNIFSKIISNFDDFNF